MGVLPPIRHRDRDPALDLWVLARLEDRLLVVRNWQAEPGPAIAERGIGRRERSPGFILRCHRPSIRGDAAEPEPSAGREVGISPAPVPVSLPA